MLTFFQHWRKHGGMRDFMSWVWSALVVYFFGWYGWQIATTLIVAMVFALAFFCEIVLRTRKDAKP